MSIYEKEGPMHVSMHSLSGVSFQGGKLLLPHPLNEALHSTYTLVQQKGCVPLCHINHIFMVSVALALLSLAMEDPSNACAGPLTSPQCAGPLTSPQCVGPLTSPQCAGPLTSSPMCRPPDLPTNVQDP